jgi:hypothetical protein
VVIVPPIGPKVRGLKPGRGLCILRAVEIRSTTSFGGEVKPSAPGRKILRHVKYHYSYIIMKEILVGKTNGHFSPSLSLLRY